MSRARLCVMSSVSSFWLWLRRFGPAHFSFLSTLVSSWQCSILSSLLPGPQVLFCCCVQAERGFLFGGTLAQEGMIRRPLQSPCSSSPFGSMQAEVIVERAASAKELDLHQQALAKEAGWHGKRGPILCSNVAIKTPVRESVGQRSPESDLPIPSLDEQGNEQC